MKYRPQEKRKEKEPIVIQLGGSSSPSASQKYLPYKCGLCDFTAPVGYLMAAHVKSLHKGYKKCKRCNQVNTTISKNTLEIGCKIVSEKITLHVLEASCKRVIRVPQKI